MMNLNEERDQVWSFIYILELIKVDGLHVQYSVMFWYLILYILFRNIQIISGFIDWNEDYLLTEWWLKWIWVKDHSNCLLLSFFIYPSYLRIQEGNDLSNTLSSPPIGLPSNLFCLNYIFFTEHSPIAFFIFYILRSLFSSLFFPFGFLFLGLFKIYLSAS